MCTITRTAVLISAVFTASVFSASVAAIEATASRIDATANVAQDIKLETKTSALAALYNELNDIVEGFAADITDLKTRMTAVEVKNTEQDGRLTPIETKNTEQDGYLTSIRTQQPTSWNTPLENRLRAMETGISGLTTRVTALESAEGGTLVYRTAVTVSSNSTSASADYDICVLTRATFNTTQDNHGHTCNLTRSADGYRLASSQSQGSTTCTMMCYDLE